MADEYSKTWVGKLREKKGAKGALLGMGTAESGRKDSEDSARSSWQNRKAGSVSPHLGPQQTSSHGSSHGNSLESSLAHDGGAAQTAPPSLGPTPPPAQGRAPRKRSLPWRLVRGFLGVVLGFLLLVAGAVAWLTSPLGERTLTTVVERLANDALASQGLRLEMSTLSGLWDGELRVFGLKLFDKDGEWLDTAEAVVYPRWSSVSKTVTEVGLAEQKLRLNPDASGPAEVLLEIRRATFFDLTLSRLPVLPPAPLPAPASVPGPLRLLPSWLELEIGEIEVVRLGLGPEEGRVYMNIHGSAWLADSQAALRLGLYAAPLARWLRGAPLPEVLNGDVTLSSREIAEMAASEASPAATSTDSGMGGQTAGPVGTAGSAPAVSPRQEDAPRGPQRSGPEAQRPTSSAADKGTPGDGSSPAAEKDQYSRLVVNVVWDGSFADVRWQGGDSFLLRRLMPGVVRLWSRSRVQVNMAQWPPSVEHPLQARAASRFGLTTRELAERVRASLFTGQVYWDGSTLVVRDLDLQVPLKDPQVLLAGGAGLSAGGGPGAGLRLRVMDLGALGRTLGLTGLNGELGGAVEALMAVGRGGRHTLWWTRPLPEPRSFAQNPLPGFQALPLPEMLAKLDREGTLESFDIRNLDEQQTLPSGGGRVDSLAGGKHDSWGADDPRASQAPTALRGRLRIVSDALKLPGGEVNKVDMVITGTSLAAAEAPAGTMQRKAATVPAGSPEDSQAASKLNSDASSHDGSHAGQDSDAQDFADSGLPRGLVGKLAFQAESFFGMGDARLRTRWMLGGLHGDADVLLLELSQLAGNIPGLRLDGDMEFSYALPVRRTWPWVDGKLDVLVDNWKALDRLVKSPVQGSGLGMRLTMESRFDEKREPRQYLRAEVKAGEVKAPTFTVRQVRGDVQSDHVHALADVVAMALTPFTQRLGSPEGSPPANLSLLDARLEIGSGSGGPVQWDSGRCLVKVAGEDANINANLTGAVQGLLEGIYNFRNRVLQIKKFLLSQRDGPGVTLLTPLRVDVNENAVLSPVELAFTPQGRARLEGALRPAGSGGTAQGQGESAAGLQRTLLAKLRLWDFPGQNAPTADSPSALKAELALPLRLAPTPELLPRAPLNAEVVWQGRVEPLWKLAPLPGRSMTGDVALHVGVEGSLSTPRWKGRVSLRDGRFVDKLEGLALQDIVLELVHSGGLGTEKTETKSGQPRPVQGKSAASAPRRAEQDPLLAAMGQSSLTLRASDGRGGKLSLSGNLYQQGSALMVQAKGALDKLRPLRRDDLQLSVSGQLALDGPLVGFPTASVPSPQADNGALGANTLLQGPVLSGALRLDQGAFTLLRGFTPSVRSLEQVAEGKGLPALASPAKAPVPEAVKTKGKTKGTTAAGRAVTTTVSVAEREKAGRSGAVAMTASSVAPVIAMPSLQLSLDAPGQFYIRGSGLDSEWRAHLEVGGTLTAPVLVGELNPVRGSFELLGRQFRFEGGAIDFNGSWPPNPSLDLTLGYKSAQLTALINVQGNAKRPQLDLTSQPPLPRDEVMAQVLFGKSMASLSHFETLQAANAARQLVDLGPAAPDVMGVARKVLGLEVLRFGSGTAQNRSTSAPRDASVRGQAKDGQDLGTTLEAGKYVTDNVYVGLEQGMRPEAGTAVRVEVELSPHISVTGRTSQQSSGVGLNWKMDY